MREVGASQEAVTAALEYARSLAASESAKIDAADNQHAAAMKAEMSQVWGNDYQFGPSTHSWIACHRS